MVCSRTANAQGGNVVKRNNKRILAMRDDISWPNVFGFALVQTWVVLCIALPDPVTYGEPFLDLRWVSLLTAFVLALVVALVRPIETLVTENRTFFIAVALLASASSLLGPASALFGSPWSEVLIYFAAIGVGAGFALLYATWYARFCARHDMTGLGCSAIASLLLVYPFANVLTADQVNPWVSSIIGSSLPLLSFCCMVIEPHFDFRPRIARRSDTLSPGEIAESTQQDRRKLCLRFGICLLLVVMVIEAARNLLLGGTAIVFYSGIANLGGATLKVICALWLMSVFTSRNAHGVSAAYRIAFMLLLGVVLCLPFLLQGNWAAHVLLDVSSFFFQMVMLMVAYQISEGLEVRPLAIFGGVRAVWAAGALAGIGIEGLRNACGPEVVQLLPVAMGLAAGLAFLFIFTDKDCVEILAKMPEIDKAPALSSDAILLARAHGITERETEIMLLLTTGRSAARIAENLGVSTATVNSHVHHIYQKLDIHSRQELIDLIEGEGE